MSLTQSPSVIRAKIDRLRTKPFGLSPAGDPRLYAWIGLAIAIAMVFKAIPSKATYIWASSDTLWPVDLFIDILRDGYSFRGWEFSIAPCWFPDIAIVGLCYLLLRNPLLTTVVAGGVQFIILLAGFCLCWRALRLAHLMLLDILTVGVGIAVTLWIAFHTDVLYPGLYQFLLPQTHVGNLIMHVYAIWLALLVIQLPPGRGRTAAVAGFALTCMAAGLSNVMFFPHTLLPLSIGLAAVAFVRGLPARRAMLPILAGWPASVAGAVAYRTFFTAIDMGAQASLGFVTWRTASVTFYKGATDGLARLDLLHVLALFWLFASLTVGCMLLWRLRGDAAARQERYVLMVVFLFTAAGASVFGPATMILGGSNGLTQFNNYMWTMHYMHPTFLLPLFAWPSLLGLLPSVRLRPFLTRGLAFSASVVCLGVPLLAFERTPAPPVSVSEYEPDFVRVLDHDAGQYGIRYGLAGYWQARLITLLSRTGLRAYPVDGSLNPLLFASNREWFTQSLEDHSRKPCLSFIVLNDPLWKLTRQMAVSHAGEPSYEFDAAGVPVMVYANGTPGHATPRCEAVSVSPAASGNGNAGVDRPLSRYVSSMSSPTTEIRAKPSEQMSIPLRIGNIGAELWSSTGKFPVTLSYKWLKSGRMLPIEGERTLLPGVVAPGAAVSVSAVVIAPPELGSYGLRFSLVQEGVTWFISSGAVPLDLPATVSPVTGTQPR